MIFALVGAVLYLLVINKCEMVLVSWSFSELTIFWWKGMHMRLMIHHNWSLETFFMARKFEFLLCF